MAVPDSAMPKRQLTNATVLLAGAKPMKYGLLISIAASSGLFSRIDFLLSFERETV